MNQEQFHRWLHGIQTLTEDQASSVINFFVNKRMLLVPNYWTRNELLECDADGDKEIVAELFHQQMMGTLRDEMSYWITDYIQENVKPKLEESDEPIIIERQV
jgi:hypothetical protein